MKKISLMQLQFTEEKQIAKFYCDTCGAYLGESITDENGCIEDVGVVSISLKAQGWFRKLVYYRKELNLCKKCKDDFFCELEESLKKFGYVKDTSNLKIPR